MTRTEHLLAKLIEECAEVQQRATKALRFGLSEIEPGQKRTNSRRLGDELYDLLAALEMLAEEDAIGLEDVPRLWEGYPVARINTIREKVETFLRYSQTCGTLEAPDDHPSR